ncbi:MAG: lactate utilization protein [Evtepia sp.]
MANLDRLRENLKARGFAYQYFKTGTEATAYLNRKLDATEIGIGGSKTVEELGLYTTLATHNQVYWHHAGGEITDANHAPVYISSLNALAETGELINIDGSGNRVAATVYGAKRVYFVVGINKLTPDYDSALFRARNIAAPKNAQRLGVKTPCAAKGDHCYDCKSPDRICRALLVLWGKPKSAEETEVIVIGEELGF